MENFDDLPGNSAEDWLDSLVESWLLDAEIKMERVMDCFQSLDPNENYQLSGSQMILLAEALQALKAFISECAG